MLLAPKLLLNILCIQNFSQIFQDLVKHKQYDLVVVVLDKTAPGIDEIFELTKNQNINWLLIDSKYKVFEQRYVFAQRTHEKYKILQLVIFDGPKRLTDLLHWTNRFYLDFVYLFTASSKRIEAALMKTLKTNEAYLHLTATVMFCNENSAYGLYYMEPRKAQPTPIVSNDQGNASALIFAEMSKNYSYKILLEVSLSYPRVQLYNNSNGVMELTGSEIYTMNFMKNNIKFQAISRSITEVKGSVRNTQNKGSLIIPKHVFESQNVRNEYKEIWANNIVCSNSTEISYSHCVSLIPMPSLNAVIFPYDSSILVAMVIEKELVGNTFEMHALVFWTMIISISGILLFIIRLITHTYTQEISLPEALLRSISAVLGLGNVGWSNRAQRAEKIFLFALIIFGLFFNIYYTDELFKTKVFGPKLESRQIKTIADFPNLNGSVYYHGSNFLTLWSQYG